MVDEVSNDDCLAIHARALRISFAGLAGMLEDLHRAHDDLQARGADGRQNPDHEPLLSTAYDVMSIVIEAVQRIEGPCNAAAEPGATDPRLFFGVNDSMLELEELVDRLSRRLEFSLGQWLTELVVRDVRREDWPAIWRVSVWSGAMLHYAEDVWVALQALMQFLSMGSIFETRRSGGEWLNEHGALKALDFYRRAPSEKRKTVRDEVSQVCVHALLAMAEASKARAKQVVAVADATLSAHFLDARDLVHLGVYSQGARRGGVFLSHRGKDAKRPLMDFHRATRPELFLDIWARPAGDTNRRFLWRNLAAAGEMHAFVTANYASSDFCMKEVEAWGLLSLGRGYAAAETPGRFFVIDSATCGPVDTMLGAWTRYCREDTTLKRAMAASAQVLSRCGALGTRPLHSEQDKDASDVFNRSLLGSGMFSEMMEISRKPIDALINLFRHGLAMLRTEGEASRESLDAVEAVLPQELPNSGAAFVVALRDISNCLFAAQKAHPARRPLLNCVLAIMAALAEVSAHVLRHWVDGTPETMSRSTFYFIKFGGVIDRVTEQFKTWCFTLVMAGFDAQDHVELFAGLVLALLPIDHEETDGSVRIDADFSVPREVLSLPLAFEAAGLARRTVQVVCARVPTFWQRVAVIAALSSFTSRSFLFIDVDGSGALTARVGALEMEEFSHVTFGRIEDLPAL